MIGLRLNKTRARLVRRSSCHDADRSSWRDIRDRCERLISTLPLPEPFDVPILLGRLTERRGRRIELLPTALPATPLCGMLISTDEADYIFHAADATPLHAQHIVMHEVGHLLLGHISDSDVADVRLAEHEAVYTLLPSLSPTLIRRVLGRTTYSHVDEREAELFASMLLARVVSPGMLTAGRGGFTEHLRRPHQQTVFRAYQPWAA